MDASNERWNSVIDGWSVCLTMPNTLYSLSVFIFLSLVSHNERMP